MSETTAIDNAAFVKGLKILFYAAVADTVLSALSAFSALPSFLIWPARLATLAQLLVLLHLRTLTKRYKKAGIFRLISLILPLGAAIRYVGLVFTLAAAVFSWLAAYQEYRGHGGLTREKDLNLADRWNGLFELTIYLAIGLGLLGAGAAWVIGRLEMNETLQTFLCDAAYAAPTLFIGVCFYLRYLKNTIRVFES